MAKKRKWNSEHVCAGHDRSALLRAARRSGSAAKALLAELQLCREHIPHELIRSEPELHGMAWIAYRYMSAFERTEKFTACYEAVYVEVHGRYKDFAESQAMKPISDEFVKNAQDEMTSLWKARQAADALGMPYPQFIRASMNAAVDQRHYNRVPRPNQLCMPWQIDAAMKAWAIELSIAMPFADDWDPRFFAPLGRNDEARCAALDLLVERISSRPPDRRADVLANYIHRRQALTEAEARERFDGELVDEAMQASAEVTIDLPAISAGPYHRGCLGFLPEVSVCSACPVRVICEKLHAVVDSSFLERMGNVDPRLVKTRLDNAERKRRQRRRIRAARAESMSNPRDPRLSGGDAAANPEG